MVKPSTLNQITIITTAVFVIFGIFLIYQIIKIIIGGSWSMENIIVSLLMLVIGGQFVMGTSLAELRANHNNLSKKFDALAADFKNHLGKS